MSNNEDAVADWKSLRGICKGPLSTATDAEIRDFIAGERLKDLQNNDLPLKHLGTVVLETPRLLLRRFELYDAEAMFRNWTNDPDVTKYLTWQPHGDVSVTRSIREKWVSSYENNSYYHWAIVLKTINEPIGSIAAVEQRDDIRMVHIGYCIGKPWWHQGYMTEALTELIRFFFEDVGMNRIESRHDVANPNSGKVMLKCGLRYEGTARQGDINNQGIHNTAYYAILAEDYFNT